MVSLPGTEENLTGDSRPASPNSLFSRSRFAKAARTPKARDGKENEERLRRVKGQRSKARGFSGKHFEVLRTAILNSAFLILHCLSHPVLTVLGIPRLEAQDGAF